jgi:hypothetical protein
VNDDDQGQAALIAIQTDAAAHLERTGSVISKIEETLLLLEQEKLSETVRARVVEALGAELQGAYTGFESVIARILKAKGVQFKKSASHHAELLEAAETHGLMPDHETKRIFYDLVGFRHFFRNSYGANLRDEEILQKGRNLCRVWPVAGGHLSLSISELTSCPVAAKPHMS